jgi:hypothetical protein
MTPARAGRADAPPAAVGGLPEIGKVGGNSGMTDNIGPAGAQEELCL